MRGRGGHWHCCPRGCVRRQHGQRLPEKSADLQLLCRFYFLISNLRQPPHNNMADGTGATQLETRPPEVQLLRAGQGDEKCRAPPGWRWRSVRMWRMGQKKRRRSAEEDDSWKKKRRARASGCRIFSKVGLFRPLLVAIWYCSPGLGCGWDTIDRRTKRIGF